VSWTENLPIWAIVFICGAVAQIVKFVAYSVTNRRIEISVLGQSHGLPSVPAAILSCLLALTIIHEGPGSAAAGFALVFAVIVVHDTVKLRVVASRQREVLYRLVVALPDAGPYHQRVAGFLDARVHHPLHVVLGVIWGLLFALAFGINPS
jgi:acid phosphatase family membrane protein YuiD